MSTSASSPRTPRTTAAPVPQPTQPVAEQTVEEETVTFDWTPFGDASSYRLQVGLDEAFDTIYHDEIVERPTRLSVSELVPEEETSIVWRVRGEDDGGSPWSSPARFSVGTVEARGGQFLVNASPVPLHPIGGEAVDASATAVAWETVPEASGYRLQVAETDAFDDPILNLTLDQITSLTLFDLLPVEASPLYWRVRALFPNETEGPWSETAVFGTAPTAPEDPSASASTSIEESAVAAGPAREGRTSSRLAWTFMGVLLVSFVLTVWLVVVLG